jgi:hypothetical protein
VELAHCYRSLVKRLLLARRISLIAAIVVSTLALTTLTPVASASAATFTEAPTPTISGTAQAYQTLTADAGTWTPAPTLLSYQWYVANTAVAGATRSTFAVPASAVGKTIRVKVTGTRSGYTTIARTSAPTDPVASPLTFELVTAPSISLETARVGLPITPDTGEWSPAPDTFTYQWYANGTPISGAKSASYTPTTAMLSKRLTVRVTARAAGYAPRSITSNASTRVARSLPFAVAPTPIVRGTYRVGSPLTVGSTYRVGSLLTAVEGGWSPGPERFGYQWYANGIAIKGATAKTFTVPATALAKSITVRVVAVLPGYTSTARLSTGTAKIQPSALSAPTIYSIEPAPLGVQVTWQPNSESELVRAYTVSATRSGTANPVGCTSPARTTVTVSASNTLAVVEGLCVGAAYTVIVRAERRGEVGPNSKASLPASPTSAAAPSAPVIVRALGRDESAEIGWQPGATDGGTPVTGYHLVADDGTTSVTVMAGANDTSATIPGLANGVDYAITVVARNAVGDSDASSRRVTPASAYAPSEPQGVSAIPGENTTIEVSWELPSDDGGTAITGYRVTYQQVEQLEEVWAPLEGAAEHTLDVAATESAATLDDFEDANGTYAISVVATNAVGDSTAEASQMPVSPTVVLQDDVVVLEDSDLRTLFDVAPDSLTWRDPVPAIASTLASGDVLVGGVAPLLPEGLLREVVSITSTASGMTVTTRAASIDDVFADLSVSANVAAAAQNQSSDPLSVPSFIPTAPGIVAPVTMAGGAIDVSNEFRLDISQSLRNSATGEKTELEGSVTVTPHLHLGLDVNVFTGVRVDASATTKIDVEVKGSIQQTHEWELGRFKLPPQTIYVGIPVVITPEIPITFEVGGKATISLSATQTFGSGMEWSSQDPGRLAITDLSKPLSLSGGSTGGLSFTGWAALKVSPILKLYALFGPGIEVALKAEATVVPFPPAGQPWFIVQPSLEISAFIKLEAFGFEAEASAKLASIPLARFTLSDTPQVAYTITAAAGNVEPQQTLKLTATRSDGASLPLTWAITGGLPGDKISSVGVLTPTTPAGRSITVTVRDATGSNGKYTVLIGKPFDPPGNLVVTGSLNSLVATWSAPPRTGNGTISRYTIETIPTSTSLSTANRTATISNLKQGAYRVIVRAINSAGQVSSATTATVYVGPPPVVLRPELAIPNPPDTDRHAVYDIECGGSTSCAAIGDATLNELPTSLTATLTGTTWTTAYPTGPPVGPTRSLAYSVSCPAAGWCLTSGIDGSTASTTTGSPLIRVFSGGTWTTTTLPIPPGRSATLWRYIQADCPTASLDGCVVISRHQDNSSWAWTHSGGEWLYEQLDFNVGLTVDCPAKFACVISGTSARVAVQAGSATWNATTLTTESGTSVTHLSCGGAGSCALVTERDNRAKSLWVLAGGSWSLNPVELPSTVAHGWPDWYALECWAPGSCLLAGVVTISTNVYARFAFRSSGDTWAEIAPLSGSVPNPNLLGVRLDCSSGGFCVYSDGYGVATLRAASTLWTQVLIDGYLSDVSCPPSGSCTVLLQLPWDGRLRAEWASLRVPSN